MSETEREGCPEGAPDGRRARKNLARLAPAVALLAAGGFALALAHGTPEARGDTLEARTLQRTEDWVIVKGKELTRLKGQRKDKLRLYALHDDTMEPIPYQIDARTPDGHYCFDQGEPELHVPASDGGNLSDEDELVFMVKDAGDRASESSFPAGQRAAQQLKVADPDTGEAGWVYMFQFDDPPDPSPRRYVGIERHNNTKGDEWVVWRGEYFYSDNERSTMNACRLTTLKFAPPGDDNPDYSKRVSVIDCSKVSLAATKLGITFHKDSSDVKVKIGGYIQGPIRVVCQNIINVNLELNIWISAPDSYVILYPNGTTMPTNASLPVDLSDTPNSSYYKLLIDLCQDAKGWKFYNSFNPDPVDIDGKMDEREKKLDTRFPDWNCVFGPDGAIVTRFVLDPRVVRDTNTLYYSDDTTILDPPEFEPGNYGTFGYKVDLSGVKSGVYTGDYLIFYSPAPWKVGDEKKFLEIQGSPLKVSVR